MLHACVQRFDVMENLEKFYKILGTKQARERSPVHALWMGWILLGFAFSFSFSRYDWIVAFGLRRRGLFIWEKF